MSRRDRTSTEWSSGTNRSVTEYWSLPVPRSPIVCQMSVNFVALFGNSIVRTTGVPFGFSIGRPSASITGTWQPSQLA